MFDIFTEEIELTIKSGIANLYWYHGDLKKAWLRGGVDRTTCDSLFSKRQADGSKFTKRLLMDMLYEQLRTSGFNRRLEISRNFVRFLVEHQSFVPQADGHRIEIAEHCALKLKAVIEDQKKERERLEFQAHKTASDSSQERDFSQQGHPRSIYCGQGPYASKARIRTGEDFYSVDASIRDSGRRTIPD